MNLRENLMKSMRKAYSSLKKDKDKLTFKIAVIEQAVKEALTDKSNGVFAYDKNVSVSVKDQGIGEFDVYVRYNPSILYHGKFVRDKGKIVQRLIMNFSFDGGKISGIEIYPEFKRFKVAIRRELMKYSKHVFGN